MESVINLVFLTGALAPQHAHNLRLVNKECGSVVKSHLRQKPFAPIQDMVQKHGFYLDSLENFRFALSLGYILYDGTIIAIAKFGGAHEVMEYCFSQNQQRVPETAIFEACMHEHRAHEHFLRKRASAETNRRCDEWIAAERRRRSTR